MDRLDVGRPRAERSGGRHRLAEALVAGFVALLLLTALSVATASGWRAPERVPPLGVAALPVVPIWVQHLPYAEVERSDTETASGLAARVVRPRGGPALIPGVVLVDDAGPTARDDLDDAAEVLASGGLAVLTFDQRGGGRGPLQDGEGRLADDALGALTALARQPGVDPGRVGLLGLGEGGAVVALAAAREPARVAFTVLVSTPTLTPLERASATLERRLAGLPVPLRAAASAALVLARPFVDSRGVDPVPSLVAAGRPSYALWGAEDATVPVAVAVARYRAGLGALGRTEVVPGAGHRVGVATGWAERVADWVRQGFPRDDEARGVEPASLVGLPTLPRPGWPGRPGLLLGLAALCALAVGLRPSRRSVRSARSG